MNIEQLSWLKQGMTAGTGRDADWPFVLFKNQRGATVNPAVELSWAAGRNQRKRGRLGVNPWDRHWPLTFGRLRVVHFYNAPVKVRPVLCALGKPGSSEPSSQ